MGCARVSAASSDDLPALGSPTRPMSASSLSDSVSQSSSPSRPFSANLGAWRVELLKQTLPRPPSPPRATSRRWPSRTRSPSSVAVGVADLGADRHLDEQLGAVGAALVGAAPVAAAGGPEVVLVAEVARGRAAGAWRPARRRRRARRRLRRARPWARTSRGGSSWSRCRRDLRARRCWPCRAWCRPKPADAGLGSGLGDDRDEAAGALLGEHERAASPWRRWCGRRRCRRSRRDGTACRAGGR